VAGERCAVTMVLPCLNEERHLPATLASLAEQEVPGGYLEVIVADGGSADASRSIAEQFRPEAGAMRVRVVDNPRRSATAGFNAGIRVASGPVIALGGARTVYPVGLVAAAIDALAASGADVVGGGVRRFIPADETLLSRTIACLYMSPFGAGAAGYHRRRTAGRVDTVYCGFYRREVLERLGGLDERFVRGQDSELNSRVVGSGGTVWFDPRLSTDYQFRGGFEALLRRGWQTGLQVGRGWLLKPQTLRWRHLAPLAWTAFVILGVAAVFLLPSSRPLYFSAVALYLGILLVSSLRLRHRVGLGVALATVPVFAIFHLCYGLGEARGLSLGLTAREPR